MPLLLLPRDSQVASKNRNIYLQLWVFYQHREFRMAFRFHRSSYCYCWFAAAFCLALQTWCIKFNSVVVRLSRIDSSVSGILILVFCWHWWPKPNENRMNAIPTWFKAKYAFSALSLMHYKWKSNFQYLQKMENDCYQATFGTSEKRARRTVRTYVWSPTSLSTW